MIIVLFQQLLILSKQLKKRNRKNKGIAREGRQHRPRSHHWLVERNRRPHRMDQGAHRRHGREHHERDQGRFWNRITFESFRGNRWLFG